MGFIPDDPWNVSKINKYYFNNFNRTYNFNYRGVMVRDFTNFVFLYPCITESPWRWPECRPKHVGGNSL